MLEHNQTWIFMSLGTEGKRRYYVTWDHWDFRICTIPPLENLWLCSNTFMCIDVLVPICLQSLDMGFSIFQTQEDLLVSSNNQKGKMPLMTLTLSNYPYSAGMHYKISTLANYTTILSYISISLKLWVWLFCSHCLQTKLSRATFLNSLQNNAMKLA